MNFDFMKKVKALEHLYKPCNNAEMLALSMPDVSIGQARKAAELLAEFVYLAAHMEMLDGLTFADILNDAKVKNYIHSRSILDGFHFIRKSGNRAVHTNIDFSRKEAVSVLQELHHISGEIAKQFGFIKSYPAFDKNIKQQLDAVLEDVEISQETLTVFLNYLRDEMVKKTKEQQMHVLYPDVPASETRRIDEHIYIHERLIFDRPPQLLHTVAYVQRYIQYLLELQKEKDAENKNTNAVYGVHDLSIRLDTRDRVFTNNDTEALMVAVERLPYEASFGLDIKYRAYFQYDYGNPHRVEAYMHQTGSSTEGTVPMSDYFEDALWTGYGMLDKLESLKRREPLMRYTALIDFLDGPDDYGFYTITYGETIDLLRICSSDITVVNTYNDWDGDLISFHLDFDFEEHRDIVNQLHDLIMDFIVDEDELEELTDYWEDGDEGVLFNSTHIVVRSMEDMQSLLDKVNIIVAPIMNSLKWRTSGYFTNFEEFGIAHITKGENGFRMIGRYES